MSAQKPASPPVCVLAFQFGHPCRRCIARLQVAGIIPLLPQPKPPRAVTRAA